MQIPSLDPAFLVPSALGRGDIRWYAPNDAPFRIYGLCKVGKNEWHRVPEDVAQATSPGVADLSKNTAGGRIRFTTDSPFVAVRAKPLHEGGMAHMAMTGIAGCDLYAGTEFRGVIRPELTTGKIYEGIVTMPEGENLVTVNLPLYNGIGAIAIGVREGSSVTEPAPYAVEQPVVFYGSSITQGGCASRPGTCYQAYLSRWFDMNYRNLGFSGNGKAEMPIVNYMASLDMRAFVMDYDHNAPTVQYLEMTHERLFAAIRKAHPDLPVLLLSRPDVDKDPKDAAQRFAVIERTYQNAVSAGDEHVWILNGKELFGEGDRRECTVDTCHPTDLGFYRMATAMRPLLAQMLEKGNAKE